MPRKTRSRVATRRRRRINGRGIGSWIGKAGQWMKRAMPHLKRFGKAGLNLYQNPAVRQIANEYAGPTARKYMGKADKAIAIGNVLQGALGNGRRRTIRLKKRLRRGRGMTVGYGLGGGLGYYK